MTRVKICGITCLEDAMVCADAGADAIGFVFADSPRRVDPELACDIASQLPPFLCIVGVFVNAHTQEHLLQRCLPFLHAVQFHGDEPPSFVESVPGVRIKSFRVSDSADLEGIRPYLGRVHAVLLDTFVPGLQGGTGAVFDWSLALHARGFGAPLVLAGGLGPDNVADAVATVRPYAVDASSRLERAPGRKDPQQVRRFVREVRRADLSAETERGGSLHA
ncbi:MAG: phosphoribosylanthranilate isomerase [Armatimonadota bacterium]